MSITLYSCKSKEACKLKNNGYEIFVDEDKEDGKTKIMFTNENGDVVFNSIYTKKEVEKLLELLSGAPINFNMFSQITPDMMLNVFMYNSQISLNPVLTETYKNLFENINTSNSNLNNYLQKIHSFLDKEYFDNYINNLVKAYILTGLYLSGTQFGVWSYVNNKLNKTEKTLDENDATLVNVIKYIDTNFDAIAQRLDSIKECNCNSGNIPDLSEELTEIRRTTELMQNMGSHLASLPGIISTEMYSDSMEPFADYLGSIYNKESNQAKLLDDHKSDQLVDPDTIIQTLPLTIIERPTGSSFDKSNPVYGDIKINGNLNVNGLINGVDINNLSSGGIVISDFSREEGYPYHYVKNKDIRALPVYAIGERTFNVMMIKLPEELLNKLCDIIDETNIFRIKFRKRILYNEEDKYFDDIYIKAVNGFVLCPIIGYDTDTKKCTITYNNYSQFEYSENELFIMCQNTLPFNPYELYCSGEMSIIYLLNQDTLISVEPTIKCDIIDAKNALKLHESDIVYLYKPTYINEATINGKDYYRMIFEIPDDYKLMDAMKFKLKEYCFGNEWSLEWNDGTWTGDNIRGRLSGNIINKLNKRNETRYYNENRCHKCFVMIKDDKVHNDLIQNNNNGLMYSFYVLAATEGDIKTKLLLNDGSVVDGFDNGFECIVVPLDDNDKSYSYEGYSLAGVVCKLKNYDEQSKHYHDLIPTIERICLDMSLPNSTTYTRLAFKFKPEILHVEGILYANIDLIGDEDTIERVAINLYDSYNEGSRNIELFLRKSCVESIDEINWDGAINPFKLVIDKQFYEISPKPEATTTLYTDYNICSSKIITADNITTMRSDLNVVSNNVDVIEYDIDILEDNVVDLQKRMSQQEILTQYLKHEVNKIKIVSGVALVLSVASTAMSAISLGVSINSAGIALNSARTVNNLNQQLNTPIIRNNVINGIDRTGDLTMTMLDVDTDLSTSISNSSSLESILDGMSSDELSDLNREIDLIISGPAPQSVGGDEMMSLLAWVNKNKEFPIVPYTDEIDNLENHAISTQAAFNICNKFRESLKPHFKVLLKELYKTKNKVDQLQISGGTQLEDANEFDEELGFPYYYVKNKDIVTEDMTKTINTVEHKYNKLKIKVGDEIKSKLTGFDKLEIFKIVLRKNVVFDNEGKYIKEFVVTMKDNTFHCPIITYNEIDKCCEINYTTSEEPDNDIYIAFDKLFDFNPYTLYMSGELSIMYLLSQDALVAKKPTIKCDIIDAKNALKLYESDVHYFYKPDIITETDEYYKMIFSLPDDYTIPYNLTFKLKEYCFGNEWVLTWDGSKWNGENCQGRINSKVINKWNLRPTGGQNHKDTGCYGCWVLIKKDELNERLITNEGNGLMYSLLKNCKHEIKLEMNDGSIKDGGIWNMDYAYENSYSDGLSNSLHPGYYGTIIKYFSMDNTNNLRTDLVEKIYLDIYVGESSTGTRLSFQPAGFNNKNNKVYVDIIPINDTIEKVNYEWSGSNINQSIKHVELYLKKEFTDPIDEVNWDSNTNAFSYIIQQQFYEITPNPNAATTLYTDFNITSSKIITADNITTMRSDLNMVTNNVDIIDYDVKELENKVDVLNSQMSETHRITKHLQEDIDENRLIASTALAFGVIGTVGSVASIGMQLGASGISFATKNGYSMLSNCAAEAADGYEMLTEGIAIFQSTPLSLRTDISPILEWVNNEYIPFVDLPYENECDNPKTTATSLYTTLDICNRFRDSLKPLFKLLGTRINEISSDVDGIDLSEQMTTLENKFDNKLKEYVNKDELVRNDPIDIFPRVDNDNHVLLFEFEDNIVSGLIVFKTFAVNDTLRESNQRQRRFYIKIVDGVIVDYKGVQEETTIEAPAGAVITIKPLARSEDDRVAYMPTAELILDSSERLISIAINSNYRITGAVVEKCTCMRQMVYTTNDIAYLQDIEALNKKIDALAEQSHTNDVQTFSMQDEFATVDEVNDVLKNYVQIKDLPPTADLSEYAKLTALEEYRKKDDLLSYTDTTIMKNVEFTFKSNVRYASFDLGYLEGAHFTLKYKDIVYDFDFTIDAETQEGPNMYYDHNLKDDIKLRWLVGGSSASKIFLLKGTNNIVEEYELLSITYPGPDEFALKSQIEELKAENEALKTTIATFEQRLSALEKSNDPDAEWKEFYSEYSEKFELENPDDVVYNIQGNKLNIYPCDDMSVGLWLLIFADLDGKKHFIEWNVYMCEARFDKFYNNEAEFIEDSTLYIEDVNITKDIDVPVDEVYRKPK